MTATFFLYFSKYFLWSSNTIAATILDLVVAMRFTNISLSQPVFIVPSWIRFPSSCIWYLLAVFQLFHLWQYYYKKQIYRGYLKLCVYCVFQPYTDHKQVNYMSHKWKYNLQFLTFIVKVCLHLGPFLKFMLSCCCLPCM